MERYNKELEKDTGSHYKGNCKCAEEKNKEEVA